MTPRAPQIRSRGTNAAPIWICFYYSYGAAVTPAEIAEKLIFYLSLLAKYVGLDEEEEKEQVDEVLK